MSVLVTGATGFLGSHVVELLTERGYQVVALARRTSRTAHLQQSGISWRLGTLDDENSLRDALRGVDTVVHLAGLVRARRRSDFFRVNYHGTRRLAEACLRAGTVRRLVVVSSIAAQGPCPRPEERPRSLPPAPVSTYGQSKLMAERAALEIHPEVSVSVLRPPIIYGPRDVEFLRLIRLAKRFGALPVVNRRQRISIIYAADCSLAIERLLAFPETGGKTYTADDGGIHGWQDIASALSKVLGRRVILVRVPLPVHFGVSALGHIYSVVAGRPTMLNLDKFREARQDFWIAGNAAISKDTGYEPQVSLDTGLRKTVAWARRASLL